MRPPLNGSKTHPLTKHALGVLRQLRDHGAIRSFLVNPGVIDRLTREDLIEFFERGSDRYIEITVAGRDRINQVSK